MAEYIEREALIERLELVARHEDGFRQSVILGVVHGIKHEPAADVVEVVRCENCAVPHNKWTGCPKLNGLVTPPNFYCAMGERKK